jgi:hypothetical protein
MNRETMIKFVIQYIQSTHINKFYTLMEQIDLAHGFYLKTIKEKW